MSSHQRVSCKGKNTWTTRSLDGEERVAVHKRKPQRHARHMTLYGVRALLHGPVAHKLVGGVSREAVIHDAVFHAWSIALQYDTLR